MKDLLTQQTGISIALVLAMCGGAFWTGGELTSMRLQSAMNEKRNNRQDALLEKLTELAADNKRRLDLAERLAAQSR